MASRGINKVILVGNLGADPDMRYMPNGDPVANISIATSDVWRDKQTGENKERTEWHRVVAFGKLGEIIGQYCRKGGKVYIEGKLQTRKWQDQNGQDRYTTEILANDMQMLDSRQSATEANFYEGQGAGHYGAASHAPTSSRKQSTSFEEGYGQQATDGRGQSYASTSQAPAKPKDAPHYGGPSPDNVFDDDDIPF